MSKVSILCHRFSPDWRHWLRVKGSHYLSASAPAISRQEGETEPSSWWLPLLFSISRPSLGTIQLWRLTPFFCSLIENLCLFSKHKKPERGRFHTTLLSRRTVLQLFRATMEGGIRRLPSGVVSSQRAPIPIPRACPLLQVHLAPTLRRLCSDPHC